MAAIRTLWSALVGLYEETLVLIGANLAGLALNLPVGLALFVIGLPFVNSEDGTGAQVLSVAIAWLLPFLPTPGNVALAGLTIVAAGADAPRFAAFRTSLRAHLGQAIGGTLISLTVGVALAANLYFYAVLTTDWVRLISILWLYGLLFWLSMHVYLVPLLVHVAEPRLYDLYRRAAFISLGHPAYTFGLLLALLAVGLASVVFLPVYALVGAAFISLAQAHALREIRRRHGDLVAEPEEGIGRL